LIIVKKQNIKILNEHTPLLFLRGLFGAIALILYFSTIQNAPLATAVTLLYLAPIFTLIFAIFLLKEKPNPLQWPFVIMSFCGALVIKSFDPRLNLKYFIMGISAAIFAALAYNMIRILKDKVNTHLIILYFPLVTIPLTLPFLYKEWVDVDLNTFLGLLALGVATQIAQVYMTKAYQYSRAADIVHFNYLTTVYALLAGVIFFNEVITTSMIVGLSLIILGVILSSRFSKK
jgi:drug/metabolite transporter (DMT)-like permease